MHYENIALFACDYGCKWWVGCVLRAEELTDATKIMFILPNGPSTS